MTLGRGGQAWLVLALASSVCVATQSCWVGTPAGHDLEFHLTTWMDAASQGTLMPRWPAGANFGFGDARFLFYPPVSWLVGSVLCRVLPLSLVPGVYVWLCLFLCGLSLYSLASSFLSHRRSLLAGVVFVLSPYLALDVYRRAAYSELLAIAWMVFAVHGAVRLHRSHSRRDVGLVAVSLGLCWLTNIPMALIGSLSLVSLALVLASRRGSRPAVLLATLATAAALAAGLSAFYVADVLAQQPWVSVESLLRALEWRDFALSPLLLVIVACQGGALAALVRRLHAGGEAASGFRRVLWALAAPAVLMLTPLSLLVWRLPPLGLIQFPYRWLAVLAVFYGLAAGVLAPKGSGARVIGGGFMVYLPCAWLALGSIQDGGFILAQTRLALQSGTGYRGFVPEWRPRGFTDVDDRPLVLVSREATGEEIDGCHPQVEAWEAERKVVRVDCPEAGVARFRLAFYPLWAITVDGLRVTGSADAIGALQSRVPEGPHVIEVRLERPATRWPATLLSMAAGVVIVLLVL